MYFCLNNCVNYKVDLIIIFMQFFGHTQGHKFMFKFIFASTLDINSD